jgi:hypothetical protein
MRRVVILFIVTLAFGSTFHAPRAGAQEATVITACRTISQPGAYVLASNLTASGDCLVVTADFVTIDLAGFLITGNGTGAGIRADPAPEGARGIAVRNGTIAGFGVGVFLTASGAIVEGLRVVGNASNGIVAVGIVRGNTAGGNVGGIVATGTVSGNTARNNSGRGMTVNANSTVSGNTAVQNGDFGIFVVCPSNIIGNTASANTGGNLVLSGEGCTNFNNLAP